MFMFCEFDQKHNIPDWQTVTTAHFAWIAERHMGVGRVFPGQQQIYLEKAIKIFLGGKVVKFHFPLSKLQKHKNNIFVKNDIGICKIFKIQGEQGYLPPTDVHADRIFAVDEYEYVSLYSKVGSLT